jgi:hypothetical protein
MLRSAVFTFLAFATGVLAQERPSGVPAGLSCSAATGTNARLGVGNGVDKSVNYFRLDENCKEIPVALIASGLTQYLDTQVGASYYARLIEGFVIDTFTVKRQQDTWLIQDNVPRPTQTANPTNSPSPSNGGGNNSSTNTSNTGAIVGAVLGSLFFASIVGVGGLFFIRKRNSRRVPKKHGDREAAGNLVSNLGTDGPALKVGVTYQVLQNHDSMMDDELSVKVGDIVQVHAIYDDGWVNGSIKQFAAARKNSVSKNKKNSAALGMQGMLPAACLGDVATYE